MNGLHWGASAPPAPTSASGFRGGDLAPVAGSDSGEGPALRRSGGRCCCHGDSLQGDCGQEMYSRNGGAELPTHALNADFAAEEVADVRHAVDAVLRELNEAESDGEVTAEELRRVRARLEAALRETKQAEVATEFVAVGELWCASGLRGGPSVHLHERAAEVLLRAAEVGLAIPRESVTRAPVRFWEGTPAIAAG